MFKLHTLLLFLYIDFVISAEDDEMTDFEKSKMFSMGRELVLDAKLQQRQLHDVIEFHEDAVSFEVGLIMGTIREKYRRMMDIYREAYYRNKHTTHEEIYDDKYDVPDAIPNVAGKTVTAENYILPKSFIYQMELVHTLEIEIDHLVRVIESMPAHDVFGDRSQLFGRTGKDKNTLREGTSTRRPKSPRHTPNPTFESAEEKLKQKFRDDYYLEKGFDRNWTLDQYYGIT